MGSSSLNADVDAFERLQIVRGWKSSYLGTNAECIVTPTDTPVTAQGGCRVWNGRPLFNNTPVLDSIRTAWQGEQGKVAAAVSGGPPVTYPSLVDDYLIEAHRDHPGTGCPVSAVGALSKMERKPIMRLA